LFAYSALKAVVVAESPKGTKAIGKKEIEKMVNNECLIMDEKNVVMRYLKWSLHRVAVRTNYTLTLTPLSRISNLLLPALLSTRNKLLLLPPHLPRFHPQREATRGRDLTTKTPEESSRSVQLPPLTQPRFGLSHPQRSTHCGPMTPPWSLPGGKSSSGG
jgi:hypothetical protein